MVILGIDPGTATTGYGVISTGVHKAKKQDRNEKPKVVDYGCIITTTGFSVGQRLGEANFVGGGGAPHDPAALIASVEQAKARKAELLVDKDWGKRYMAGGSKEIQEMAALDMRIVGVDARGEAL